MKRLGHGHRGVAMMALVLAGCWAGGASAQPLRLQSGVEPTLAAPALRAVPPGFEAPAAAKAKERAYYFVQFDGPITAADRAEAEALGEIIEYVPEFAYLVRMEGGKAAAAKSSTAFRYVAEVEPVHKVASELREASVAKGAGEFDLTILGYRGEDLKALVTAVEVAGATVARAEEDAWGATISATAPASAVGPIAAVRGVSWVEETPVYTVQNEQALLDAVMDVRDVYTKVPGTPLRGAGQVIGILDSGLDQGSVSAASLNNDFEDGAGTPRVLAILNAYTPDTPGDFFGHGTHVSGSVLGNGANDGVSNPATNSYPAGSDAGGAPEAQFVFQSAGPDVDNPLTPGVDETRSIIFSGANGLYVNLYAALQATYNVPFNARLHTNSWGSDSAGAYNSNSQDVDQFMWDFPDMLAIFAAGNAGTDGNADGVIDPGSIGAPATSKSALSVGASENNRPADPNTWTAFGYGNAPFNTDGIADDIDGMAAFSSRGPTVDGRYKPDIVAPGTRINSVRTFQLGTPPFYYQIDGTSMATPLAAGAAVLTRQYYTDVVGHTPSAALVKATLLNGAADMFPGQYGVGAQQEIPSTRPTNVAGWGRVDLERTILPDAPRGLDFIDEDTGINTGQTLSYPFEVVNNGEPLSAVLAWSDFPASTLAPGLVNDLDLRLVDPSSTVYTPNNPVNFPTTLDIDYSGFGGSFFTGGFGAANYQIAVRYTPPSYPATLTSSLFLLRDPVGTQNDPVTLTVWDDNGAGGTPGTILGSGVFDLPPGPAGTQIIGVNWGAGIAVPSGDVWVGIQFGANAAGQPQFAFEDTNIDGRTFVTTGGPWGQRNDLDMAQVATFTLAPAATAQDRRNNVVGIDVAAPITGQWTLEVEGFNVPMGPQPFAVALSGASLLDSDGDSAPDRTENMAANNGDGNNDGIPDREQNDAASMMNAVGTGTITVVPSIGTISDIQAINNPNPAVVLDETQFPQRFMQFTIEGLGVGSEENVDLFFSTPLPASADSAHKYDPNAPASLFRLGNTAPRPFASQVSQSQWRLFLDDGQFGDNDGVENGIIIDPIGIGVTTPLFVELIDFTATREGNGVRIDWTTGSEIDSAGFNLYRGTFVSEGNVTVGAQLNGSLIPAQFPTGGAYTFLDSAPLAVDEVRYYWLEEVDLSSGSTFNGPLEFDSKGTTGVSDWMIIR